MQLRRYATMESRWKLLSLVKNQADYNPCTSTDRRVAICSLFLLFAFFLFSFFFAASFRFPNLVAPEFSALGASSCFAFCVPN
jgi:CBS-domain-containing membrane protein